MERMLKFACMATVLQALTSRHNDETPERLAEIGWSAVDAVWKKFEEAGVQPSLHSVGMLTHTLTGLCQSNPGVPMRALVDRAWVISQAAEAKFGQEVPEEVYEPGFEDEDDDNGGYDY